MNSRNNIHDELNELNSGLNSNSNNPYFVPEGYFEGLAASVLAKIKGESPASAMEELVQLSPFLADISKKMPYAVPEDFFQSNIEGLKAFTSESEESLVLSFIDKEMPYEVPVGYFANVPEQVLEKVSGRQDAKVVPMGRRKWMRLAVAAAVAGIMVVSGIFYFNNRGGSSVTSDPAMAVKKASTKELNDFINATAVTDDKSQVTVNNSPKAAKIFADVSDKELNDFLDQMPTDDEIDIN
jgi:hypothetical protein